MEDLSKLKQPAALLFQQEAKPVLWTNKAEDADEDVEATLFSFGFWCGDMLCLIPLQADDQRRGYWRCPVCDSEDDAKRVWFLIQRLMDAVDGTL